MNKSVKLLSIIILSSISASSMNVQIRSVSIVLRLILIFALNVLKPLFMKFYSTISVILLLKHARFKTKWIMYSILESKCARNVNWRIVISVHWLMINSSSNVMFVVMVNIYTRDNAILDVPLVYSIQWIEIIMPPILLNV